MTVELKDTLTRVRTRDGVEIAREEHDVGLYLEAELREKYPQAWECAHEKWAHYQCEDDWYESVYEMAKELGKMLGFTIETIHFSGFCSQGDGACWLGEYAYEANAHNVIREAVAHEQYAELHRIADELLVLQKRNSYALAAQVTHQGRYQHSGTMQVDVESMHGHIFSSDDDEAVTRLLRDYADWIYGALEREHDYQRGEEQFKEDCANEDRLFHEDGTVAADIG